MTTTNVRLCGASRSEFNREATARCLFPRGHDGSHWSVAIGDRGGAVAEAWDDDNAELPVEPGFYVGDYQNSPSGKILIELLNTGEWVDNTDSRYLRSEWVNSLGNLTRLVEARPNVRPEDR